jgi:hypothetical protein
VDELRDLILSETDILLTHSYQLAKASRKLTKRKRCDERLASRGGESFLISVFRNKILA